MQELRLQIGDMENSFYYKHENNLRLTDRRYGKQEDQTYLIGLGAVLKSPGERSLRS